MADFRKESGNSTEQVELIAVVRPKSVAYKKDEEGKRTSEVSAHYVEVMVNNSALKKADIQAGKGQAQPELYSKRNGTYTNADGKTLPNYDNGIRLTPGQLNTIEAAGGSKTLTKEDGTLYIPFKADVMPIYETVKGEDGKPKPRLDKDGKPMEKDGKPLYEHKMVGYMPNTKTVTETELGNLTQNRLDKHYANTTAINEVADAKKNAKMAEAASKAAPEAEAGEKQLGE